VVAGSALGLMLLAAPVLAGWPGDAAKCKPDAVKAGSVCMDKYEASVWQVPATNKGLLTKIQNGTATLANLQAGGATQRGVSSDDYDPTTCPNYGQGCADIYAVSISGVISSSHITWFQAQQACFNARKRLPSNGEWQGAVAGTPDPGPDYGLTDCNTASAGVAVNTGSRSACVSRFGAFDMVGNLGEWVADWVPRSITCSSWSGSDDAQCLVGVQGTGEPGALVRGFGFGSGASAGPFAVQGAFQPSQSNGGLGFRCAR
jgi:formylglycine-generating enzyme required for sulfatase activity